MKENICVQRTHTTFQKFSSLKHNIFSDIKNKKYEDLVK